MRRTTVKVRDLINWILIVMFGASFILPIFQMQVNPYLVVFLSLVSIFLGTKQLSSDIKKQCLILTFFVMYGFITILYNSGGIGGIYTTVSGCVLFLASREIKFSGKQVLFIIVCLLILNIYWTIQSPTWYELSFYDHWRGDGTLTNSNGVGKYICYSAILIYICLRQSNNKIIKYLRYILLGSSIWGIYNVRARISLLVICVFVLLDFWLYLSKNKNVFIKYTFCFAIIAEIVFPFIYLMMYYYGIGSNIKMFGLSEKGLYSGRQTIWLQALGGMNSLGDWFLGVGSNQEYWTGHVLNMHNNFMNLLVVVGVIGTIFFIVFLYNMVVKNYDANNKYIWQNQLMLFFIVVLLEGCTDITIFYNDFNLYIYLPLGIACSSKIRKRAENDIEGI